VATASPTDSIPINCAKRLVAPVQKTKLDRCWLKKRLVAPIPKTKLDRCRLKNCLVAPIPKTQLDRCRLKNCQPPLGKTNYATVATGQTSPFITASKLLDLKSSSENAIVPDNVFWIYFSSQTV
jgi:hypothetical protein